jgi:hypothetical protein
MAHIQVTCKNCRNVFDWNDQWPDGLKRCPLCGIIAVSTCTTPETLRESSSATIHDAQSIIQPAMSESNPTISKPAESRFLAFFDECGDHALDKIDRDFPLFVLALVVVERSVYQQQVLAEFNRFKLRYFNHEGINLHSRDIRLASGPFSLLLNSTIRRQFMTELSGIMAQLPFTLFISAIRKQPYFDRHGSAATNPYELALEFTMEQLAGFLSAQGETHLPIVAEARGKREDNTLEQVFYRIMTRGTANVSAEQFKQLDCPLSFHSKKSNILGVQLADLCAHPCARHILNPAKENRAFEVAQKHLYQQGVVSGWKVFP